MLLLNSPNRVFERISNSSPTFWVSLSKTWMRFRADRWKGHLITSHSFKLVWLSLLVSQNNHHIFLILNLAWNLHLTWADPTSVDEQCHISLRLMTFLTLLSPVPPHSGRYPWNCADVLTWSPYSSSRPCSMYLGLQHSLSNQPQTSLWGLCRPLPKSYLWTSGQCTHFQGQGLAKRKLFTTSVDGVCCAVSSDHMCVYLHCWTEPVIGRERDSQLFPHCLVSCPGHWRVKEF